MKICTYNWVGLCMVPAVLNQDLGKNFSFAKFAHGLHDVWLSKFKFASGRSLKVSEPVPSAQYFNLNRAHAGDSCIPAACMLSGGIFRICRGN